MKVSPQTLKALHRVAGELRMQRGETITIDDAINFPLGQNSRSKCKPAFQSRQPTIEADRNALLAFLTQKVEGAGPEDFTEYDFEDVGE